MTWRLLQPNACMRICSSRRELQHINPYEAASLRPWWGPMEAALGIWANSCEHTMTLIKNLESLWTLTRSLWRPWSHKNLELKLDPEVRSKRHLYALTGQRGWEGTRGSNCLKEGEMRAKGPNLALFLSKWTKCFWSVRRRPKKKKIISVTWSRDSR